MARRKPAPVIPTTSLVASAVRYAGNAARIYQSSQAWQHECYRHYAICGEARFAARFFGHALSRATLHIAKLEQGKLQRQDSGVAVDTLAELFNGKDGQAQMLDAIGVHLTIAGECYLVGREIDGEDTWEVVSVLEMNVSGTNWSIKYGDGLMDVQLSDDDVIIRIWRPNPGLRIEADSPFKSLLPILSEIEWLTRHIFAQTQSRLAGAGLLLLPQEMTFPPPPTVDGKPAQVANEAEGFMLTLADAMLAPIEDPSSPSSIIPVIATAPGEHIDKARLMHFWSELDAAALEMRSEAIRRFALGMDLPPEQMLGMSSNSGTGGGTSTGVSHWGAWQIEEATIKMHIEPMLELVCNSVTVGYIRPAIEGDAGGLVPEFVIFDSSALRLRPDRSTEALELWDRGLLKAEVVLRECGFDPADMPDEEERKEWLLRKVASGSNTPEQVGAALRVLGIPLEVPAQVSPPEEPTREARPTPSLLDHPERPRTPAESHAAVLLAACEPLTLRALERVGNRLRGRGLQPPGVPSYETHCHVKANGKAATLLEDAFTCAPQVLQGIADEATVMPVLESYVQTLVSEQSPHTRERLAKWLEMGGVG